MRTTRKDLGFTLMEVLIVLAIVSILLTIGLPRLLAYRARAARAEAMTHMSSLAKSQHAYFAEHQSFTDDLTRVEWTLSGAPRYLYGFTTDAVPATSGRNDTGELRAAGGGRFDTAHMVDGFGVLLSEADLPSAPVSPTTFRIGAVGNVDLDPTLDSWVLDKDGTLANVSNDLEN